MIKNIVIGSLFILLVPSFSQFVWAFDDIAPDVIFPAVVQGHHGDSSRACSGAGAYSKQLEQKDNAKINGTEGRDLNFCSESAVSRGCDSGNGGYQHCGITFSDISGLSLTGDNAFKRTSSNTKVNSCPSAALGSDGNTQFKEIKLNDECSVSFSQNHSEYRIKKLELKEGGELILPSGDYWIEEIKKDSDDLIIRPNGNVRIFIGEGGGGHVHLKDSRVEENLSGTTTIVVYDHLELKGNSVFNALIYADVHVTLKDNAIINGRVTSGRIKMEDNAVINATNTDPRRFDIKFGKAINNSVTFDTAFPVGELPLVFLMPTISTNNPVQSDGPASAFVTGVSNTGFTWQQREPAVPRSQVPFPSLEMTEVDWIAVLPGEQLINNNTWVKAGVVEVEDPLYLNTNNYESVSMGRSYDVVLSQLQSANNNCWLTSTATISNIHVNLGIDVSEVVDAGPGSGFGNKYCEPGDIKLNKLEDEEVAYLALQSGDGVFELNGQDVRYQIGVKSTRPSTSNSNAATLNQQCDDVGDLIPFAGPPVFVAGKLSRKGNNGGWLRRCQLTKDTVSMVTDEDQYQNTERVHVPEEYGFVAFEYESEPPAVNHYRISFDSGALSCAAKSITLQACADSNCSSLLSDPVFVTLTKNGANYSSETFIGSTNTEVWHPQGGLVTLGLGATVPSADYSCYIDGNLVGNAQCQLNFEDSGIYFNIDDSTSCKNSNNFELFAVKKDQTTQQCVPLFANQTKPLSMAFNYITPDAAGINEAAKLTVNSLNAPIASKVIAGGSSEELQVHFDANGKALLNVNYPEAGKVELAVTLTEVIESPDGSTSETLVLEHSDQFVSKPDGFHFFNTSGKNGCSAAVCDLFAKAGDDFNMSVKAVCGVDDGTPYKDRQPLKNFQFTDLKIKPVLQAPLVANGDDKDGGLGALGQTSVSFSKANSAPLKVTNQTYSEVGAISLALDGEVNYLGATIAEANASSDTFGRFSPYYLTVSANEPSPDVQCGSFTYMDQPFGFSSGSEPTLSIIGKNKAGAETRNYQIGDWWRYHGKQWLDRSYSDTSGAKSMDGAALHVLDESPISGIVEYYPINDDNSVQRAYLSGAQLHYARTASAAVPFNGLFDLTLSKSDVTDKDGICYRDTASDKCREFEFEDIAKDDAFALRYGRFVMQNAYGPSSEELRLEVGTQYVNTIIDAKAQWVTNTSDSCSVFDTTSATESADIGLHLSPDAGLEGVQAFTQSGGLGKAGTIGLGKSFIYFPAPNSDGEVGLQQHLDKWLQWYWDFDSSSDLQDPRATAYFGTYRGHDRIIYWREVN